MQRKIVKVMCILVLSIAGFICLFNFNDSVSLRNVVQKNYAKAATGRKNTSVNTLLSILTQDSKTAVSTLDLAMAGDSETLIHMSTEEFWKLATDSCSISYAESKNWNSNTQNILNSLKDTQRESITVNVWHWKNPSARGEYRGTDLEKISAQETFTVNKYAADLFAACFEDIYNDPSQPVIYNYGGWVVRNIAGTSRTSGHAYGLAVDINAEVNRVVNGHTYGNQKLGSKTTIPYSEWQKLPEDQYKYMILYEESPVVQTFYKYGFVWGGVWNNSDAMHFSFLGDGDRTEGLKNHKKVVGD